jgi:hypothetical protein
VTFAAGYQAVDQAMVVVLAGNPLYAFLKGRWERLGLVAEPIDQIEGSATDMAEPASTRW